MNSIEDMNLPFPLPPFLELLGIRVLQINDGCSKLSMPFHEKLTQPYGYIHGGALFTIADAAAAYAVRSVVDKNKMFVTVEMKINFIEPVREGTVICDATVLRKGKIIPVEIDVKDDTKSTDLGFVLGVALGISKIHFDVRYIMSMSTLDDSSVDEDDLKNSVLMATAGISL